MKDIRGYVMIAAAAAFWGISATLAKILLNQQVDTILIVQSRVTFSFLILAAFFAFRNRSAFRISGRGLGQCALAGIAGIAGANFTYYYAIREGTVATAILIQYTAPMAVMSYGALTRTESFSRPKVMAAALSLVGCFLAVGAFDRSALSISLPGLISAVGAMLTFAFLNIYSRRVLAVIDLWTMTIYSFLFASVFWLFLNPPWTIAAMRPTADTWFALLVLAVVSVLIPHSLFFAGLRHLVPTRAVITSTLEPIVAIVSAALILGELLSPVQTFGTVVVLVAIILLQKSREEGRSSVSTQYPSTENDAA